MKANSTLSISCNASCKHNLLAVAMFFLSMLFLPVGLKAQVAQPTITADTDLNNLVCGQTVTLTANGSADDYFWYSDAGCTNKIGQGATYTFQVTDQPFSIYCKAGQVVTPASSGSQTFSYTGSVQTFTVPTGAQSLKLEVWGAQGGDATYGGKGGYSVGTLNNLSGISNLYVYVGQQPTSTTGGWNGGGGYTSYGSSGGGATDISLHNYTYNTTSHYNDRIIVAGGGGGKGYSSTYGGAGGGLNGITGGVGSASSGGGGASQTSGGSGGTYSSNTSYAGTFGTASTSSSHNGGGGGGGWYGGGSGVGAGTDAGGGGGSGYVWSSATASNVPSGYSVSSSYYLTNAQTIAGNTSFPAPGSGNETGHSGSGYARITYNLSEVYAYSSAASVSVSAGSLPPTPIVTVSDACVGHDATLTVTNAVQGLTYGWWDNASCTGAPLHEGTTYTVQNMQSNTTYYVRSYSYSSGSSTTAEDFSYTGAAQSWTVPAGITQVKLEVWGAEGGKTNYNSYTWLGGLGGYSVGNLSVSAGDVFNVYVGGKGGNGATGSTGSASGGWNGGGNSGSSTNSSYFYGGGGGGATDIRLNANTLNDRIIVAGGGGGGAYGTNTTSEIAGGYGGGTSGTQGTYNGSYSGRRGGAGTQSSGGAAGTGGSAGSGYAGSFGIGGASNSGAASGGGGGGADGSQCSGTGGGGSGYVSSSLTDAQTIAGNTIMPNPEGGDMTGRTGHGFARITYSASSPTCQSGITPVQVDVIGVNPFTLTAPQAACHNTTLALTAPNVNVTGTSITDQGWEISSDNSNWSAFSANTQVTYSQNGYYIRYYVTTADCGTYYNTNDVQITVHGLPSVAAITAPAEICTGNALTLTAPAVTDNGSTVITEGWQMSADGTGYSAFNPSTTLTDSYDNYYLRYFAENGCGTTYGNAVNITVNPAMAAPTVNGATSIYCGQTTTLTAVPAYNSEYFTYRWYSDPQGQDLVYEGSEFTTPALTADTTYYLQVIEESRYVVGTPTNYNSSGSHTYSIPSNADRLKLEVWGAQGGGSQVDGNTSGGVGGMGGYSVGTLSNLSGLSSINVYVGGQGGTSSSAAASGGWNGGGTAYASSSSDPACGGGGATDIRLNGTTLNHRIIVAGGGGGGGEDSELGGAGGGTTGITGASSSTTGGTQTGGGTGSAFGIGASTQYDGGAGGGGWYGGGCGGGTQTIPASNSTSDSQGGCGGSGYVWTAATASYAPSGYSVPSSYYLIDAQTIAGNTEFPAPGDGTETGHAGDGYARITPYTYVRGNCPSELIPVDITISTAPAPEVTVTTPCQAEDVTLTVTNAATGLTYGWWTDASCTGSPIYEGTSYIINNIQSSITYYVRAYYNTSSCQTAITTVPVEMKAFTIASITAPQAVCDNQTLALTAPNLTVTGTSITAQGWEISADNSNWSAFTANTPVTYSQNGYYIRYSVTTADCGTRYSNAVQFTVNDVPAIAATSAPAEICTGNALTLTAPAVTANGSTVNTEGWQMSADGSNYSAFNPSTTLTDSYDNYYLRYFAENGCGTTYGNAVNITVNPSMTAPTVNGATSIYCGQTTTLTAVPAYNSEHFTYRWYSDPQGQTFVHEGSEFTTPALTANTTYYLQITEESRYVAGTPTTYSLYGIYTYSIPSNADRLKLEVWGAQGGGQPFTSNTGAGVGGLGGYSVGTMPVQGNETLYVYVGGHGGTTDNGTGRGEGGYNGGGCTYTSSSSDPANGGGGATDIRLNGNTYYDRIIVAGGGGGGGEDGEQGGYGGGLSGSGTYAATQTSAGNGGIFGHGAHTPYDGGGAGGGWYGGGANGGSQTIPTSDTNSDNNGGSGGSGYVWTASTASNAPSGYNVPSSYYLIDAQTIAGNTEFPAPGGGTETGHTGSGYARITPYTYVRGNCPSELIPVDITITTAPAPVVTVTTPCQGEDVTLSVTNAATGLTYGWWTDASCTGSPIYEGTSYIINNIQSSATYYVRAYYTLSLCQTAITAVPVEMKAFTIASITAPQTVCDNQVLALTNPTVTVTGTTINAQSWEISSDNSNWSAFTASAPVTFSQNGYYIRYAVTTADCGTRYSNAVQITVNDQPTIDGISSPDEICTGESLALTAPAVTDNGSTVSAEGWQMSADGTGYSAFNPSTTLTDSYDGYFLRYFATNGCGTTYGNAVSITVNPSMTAPTVEGATSIYCGQTTTLTAVPAYSSEHFTYRWYSDPQGQNLVYEGNAFTTPALTANTTYYLQVKEEHYVAGTPTSFSSSGSYTYSVTGNPDCLKLEVWGAQGGNAYTSYNGGAGGYSVGTLSSPSGTLYVCVGGQGTSDNGNYSSGDLLSGGYNGGGAGRAWSGTGHNGAGGGGATHIATSSGLLSSFSSNTNPILLVAGGGGGASDNGNGGCGGGTSGTAGSCAAGTQSSGSAFLYAAPSSYTSGECGGGGGGWYGGYGGASENESGGGGSGYISSSLTNAQTIAGNATMPNPNGGTMTGRRGSGYARITPYYYVQDNCPSELLPVTVTITTAPAPIVSVSSTCQNEDVTLTVTNVEAGLTYGWWTDASCTGTPIHEGTSYTINNIQNNATYYVRAYYNINTCQTAITTVPVEMKAFTIASITAPQAVCDNQVLALTAPSLTVTGTPITTQGWEISADNSNWSAFTASTPVSFNQSGYYIRYAVTTADCGTRYSNAVQFTVNNVPSVAAITAPARICTGNALTLTAPAVTANGSAVSTEGWQISADDNTWSGFSASDLVVYSQNGYYLRYSVENGCGMGYSNTVNITVDPAMAAPTVNGVTSISCGQSTTLTAVPAYSSENFTYRWYADPQGQNLVYEGSEFTTPALTTNTTYYLQVTEGHYEAGTPSSYSSSGSYTYPIPSNADHLKLEVWGAQGGNAYTSYNGGAGGYSVGTLSSPSGTLYICVGGQGTSDNGNYSSGDLLSGGYNGGGAGRAWSGTSHNGGGGGGATHIATSSGVLSSFSSNTNPILLVAGGGGGASDNGNGGCGGGTSGTAGSCAAGTQSSGSAFLYAAASSYTSGECGGGGGGWYGGYGGASENESGGGGSGYISSSLTNAQTIAGNATMPNPNGGTMTGRQGSGYARITPYHYVQDNCPSELIPVTVTISTVTISEFTDQTICDGESYVFRPQASGNGTLSYSWTKDGVSIEGTDNLQASEAGTYAVTVTANIGNCTATESTSATLTINHPTHVAYTETACESYTWTSGNGETYTASGNYTYSHTDANGCTQVDTLHLTVNNPTHVAYNETACESYTWTSGNGETYTTSGNYTYSHTDDNGCTQVDTLHLTVNNPMHMAYIETACESYTWTSGNGETYTTSGNYTYSHTDANGCTQVDTLHLTINNPTHMAYNETACESYTWTSGNGETYTASGNYTYSHTDANGCTQVDTLHLTINNPTHVAYSETACESYTWTSGNGETYTTSGNYTYSHTDDNGCTQVDTLHLTINHPMHVAYNETACGSYTWTSGNGETYTTSGNYTYSHTDANGCTQVDTLHLTVNHPTHVAFTETACGSYTWTSGNGQTYTESGNYTYEHVDANGCTQVDTLHLTINNPMHVAYIETACESYTWTSGNGETYTTSGNYTYRHTDDNGCTQVDTLHLTVNHPTHVAYTETVCESYTWTAGNGETYTTSGNYTYSHTDANGCTQVDTLHLTINNPTHVAYSETACESYTWTSGNGETYTTSGNYTYSHTDDNGCTQVDTLHLTVNYVPTIADITAPAATGHNTTLALTAPAVTTNGSSVSAQGWQMAATANGTYEAFDPATPVTYSQNGYWIRYTATNGCGATYSNAVQITISGASEIADIATPDPICAGATLSLTTPNVTDNGSTITAQGWQISANGQTDWNNFTNGSNVTYSQNGYHIRYFATNSSGTSTSNTVQITVNDVPVIPNITAPAAICAGNELDLAEVTVESNGTEIITEGWAISSDNEEFAEMDNGETFSYEQNGYYIQYFAQNACGTSTSNTVQITVNDAPAIPDITAPGEVCSGSELALTTPNVADNGSTISAQGWQMAATVNGTFEAFDPATAVTYSQNGYYIRYTATNGCGTTTSNAVAITVNDAPVIGDITTPAAVCAGSEMALSTPNVAANGSTISAQGWQMAATVNGTFEAFDPTTAISYSQNGYYIRYAVTSECGNTHGNTVQITVKDAPSNATMEAPAAVCDGEALTLTAPAIAENGAAVNEQGWQISADQTTWADFTNGSNVTYSQNGYYIRYTATNSCNTTNGNAVRITVNALPVATLTAAVNGERTDMPVVTCAGNTVTLTAEDGYSYSWKKDGVAINQTGNVLTLTSITATDAGSYAVTLTNVETQCAATSEAVSVSVNALPTISLAEANGLTTICADSAFHFVATSGQEVEYAWLFNGDEIDGATDDVLRATEGGTYAVVVTDENGCSNTSNVMEVTVNALPAVTASHTNVSCEDMGSGTLTVTNGGAPLSCLWNNEPVELTAEGDNFTVTITGLSLGDYPYVITNTNGCVTEGTVSVEDPGGLSISQSINGDETCERTGITVNYGIEGGTAPYTLTWVDADNELPVEETMVNTMSGSYNFTLPEGVYRLALRITDTYGCWRNSDDIIEVTVWPNQVIEREISVVGSDTYEYNGVTYTLPDTPADETEPGEHGCETIIHYVVNRFDLEIVFTDRVNTTKSTARQNFSVTPIGLMEDPTPTVNAAQGDAAYFFAYVNNPQGISQFDNSKVDMRYELYRNGELIPDADFANYISAFKISTFYDKTPTYFGQNLTSATGETPENTFAYRTTTNANITPFNYFNYKAFVNMPNKIEYTFRQPGTYTLKLVVEERVGGTAGTVNKAIYNPYYVDRRIGPLYGGKGNIPASRNLIASRSVNIVVAGPQAAPSPAPTGIEENAETAARVEAYPNPVRDQLNLRIEGLEGTTTVTITDAQGKLLQVVEENLLDNEATLTYNVKDLAQGIYFIYVRNNGHTIAKKFVVTRE